MFKRVFVIVTVLAVLAAFSLSIEAQGRRSHKMMKHAGFNMHMVERHLVRVGKLLKFKNELGLTEKQVATMEKMQQVHKETMIRKEAEIKILALKLKSYMKQDKIDRKEMEKRIRKVAGLKTDLQVDRIGFMLDIKDQLTKEQLKKIDRLKVERIKRKYKEKREWKERQKKWKRKESEKREWKELQKKRKRKELEKERYQRSEG